MPRGLPSSTPPYGAGPLGGVELGFLGFSLAPRAQVDPCAPGPGEGAVPSSQGVPGAPLGALRLGGQPQRRDLAARPRPV